MVKKLFLLHPVAVFAINVPLLHIAVGLEESNGAHQVSIQKAGNPSVEPAKLTSERNSQKTLGHFIPATDSSDPSTSVDHGNSFTGQHPCSSNPSEGHPCVLREQQGAQKSTSRSLGVEREATAAHVPSPNPACMFSAGTHNTSVQQLFAPSCTIHWQHLALLAHKLGAEKPGMQLVNGNQASRWKTMYAPSAREEKVKSAAELILQSQQSWLATGESTTVIAEVVDAQGQLLSTDCGSISLHLLQQGGSPQSKPRVSGLGVQLLKGGRASWRLTLSSFVHPFLALQAVPRLCVPSISGDMVLLESYPLESLLKPATLLLGLSTEWWEKFMPRENAQANLNNGFLVEPKGHPGGPPQSVQHVIATIELLTREERLGQACSIKQTTVKRSSSITRNPPLRKQKALLTRKRHSDSSALPLSPAKHPDKEHSSELACQPLTLSYEAKTLSITFENPVFFYTFRLSQKPLLPVDVTIFAKLESAKVVEGTTAVGPPLTQYAHGGAGLSVARYQLVVDGEEFLPGDSIALQPEEWDKPIRAAFELSVASAASAAAALESGGAPLRIAIEHILRKGGTSAKWPATDYQGPPPTNATTTKTVSVHCRLQTYVDDFAGETHQRATGRLRRPILVGCRVQASSDVDGDVRVKVSAGKLLRLITPVPGSELVLSHKHQGKNRQEKSSLLEAANRRAKLVEKPSLKAIHSEAYSQLQGNRKSLEVTALLLLDKGDCTASSCTLSFDLGSRDERKGGDLQLSPIGGTVVLLPQDLPGQKTFVPNEPERSNKQTYLARSWSLTPSNRVRAEVVVAGGKSSIEEVLDKCLAASCTAPGNFHIEAQVRCVTAEPMDYLYNSRSSIDIYITLKPAVSCTCLLTRANGEEIGDLLVMATTSELCAENTYYDRDTATCQQCPRGFSCSHGRLLQCSDTYQSSSEKMDAQNCFICPVQQRCDVRSMSLVGVGVGSTPVWRCNICNPLSSDTTSEEPTVANKNDIADKRPDAPCPTGFHVVDDACSPCPPGFACTGSTAKKCAAGELGSTGSLYRGWCEKCPAGHACPSITSNGGCLLCPGGFACKDGKMRTCEKLLSYSLPGDLICHACPPGHECLDPSQPPASCKPGESVVSDYEEGGRRCAPCPPDSPCPSTLLALPTSNALRSESAEAALQMPSDVCHTHYTDPKCPKGGICWAGRFFPCPRGQRVSPAGAMHTRCTDFASKCEAIEKDSNEKDTNEPCTDSKRCAGLMRASSSADSDSSYGYTPGHVGTFYEEANRYYALAAHSKANCPEAHVMYCTPLLKVTRAGMALNYRWSTYTLTLVICRAEAGICEAASQGPRLCPPGFRSNAQGDLKTMNNCTVCTAGAYCHAYHIHEPKDPPYHGNVLPAGTA
ncbi:hypothetical protein Efla_006443 [Eimeria flavescens]